MGVQGFLNLNYIVNDSYEYSFYFRDFINYNVDALYHGIDWVYTTVQTVYCYDFRVWYFWFFNSIYDDSFDFFFSSYWYFSLLITPFQLFSSVILDQYVTMSLFKFPYSSEWLRSILSSKESSLILIYHPELCFVKSKVFYDYYIFFFSNLSFSLYDLIESEIFFSPVILLPQLLFLIFLSVIFINFYFSHFLSYTKEESMIDSDYLVCFFSTEAEKEISSFDDMILGSAILFYVFGWYFCVNCWSMLSMMPELILVFYLFPGLYYVIVGIPTFLAYDLGIYFLVYLRGVAASSTLFVELVFDYIAVVIFYTRILVQGVRLVLMIFTYASMHDLVLLFNFGQKMFLGSETFWGDLSSVSITLDSMSYFFLFTLPGKFIYWIYEILHTYFVVTVQCGAFFAIVFWLYLFLYTFFVFEKQENYFTEKRQFRKKLLGYLNTIKE